MAVVVVVLVVGGVVVIVAIVDKSRSSIWLFLVCFNNSSC